MTAAGLTLGAVLAAAYLLLLRRRPAAMRAWPHWRTAAWLAGCLGVVLALSAPLAAASLTDHRAHMLQHLLLGMYAPLGLVAAAPVSLLLGSLPTRSARRVTALLQSVPLRFLSHPLVAALLNIGGMFLVYLTPVYERAVHSPLLNAVVLLHFLLAGWLYTWAIAGPDPAPHRPGLPVRLAVLVVAAGAHAYLAKLLYARADVGHHEGMAHAEAGAQLMYYGGDLAELLLVAMLLGQWYRRSRPRSVAVPATP